MPFQLPDPLVVDSEGRLKAWSVQRDLEAITSRYPLAANTDNFAQVPQCRAERTANQSIGNNAFAAIQFDLETYDLGTPSNNQHDTVTNNTRLTCRVPGLYAMAAGHAWDPNATNARVSKIRLNGTTDLTGDGKAGTTLTSGPVSLNAHYRLVVGDFVELHVFQNSGIALNAIVSNTPMFLSWVWVSP